MVLFPGRRAVAIAVLTALATLSIGFPLQALPASAATSVTAELGLPVLLKFRAPTDYPNPLNVSQVNVTAVFTGSGTSLRIPCYPYSNGVWAVRFTPLSLSTYDYEVSLRNSTGTYELAKGQIEVVQGTPPMGFASAGDRYFYSNGKPVVLIGEDVAWASIPGDSPTGWEYYVAKVAQSGGNWVRLWSPYAATWFSANYSELLDFALGRGVYVQYCMFSPYSGQSFSTGPEWENVAPEEFFGSAKMVQLEEFWVRSLIGRYSAFPNLFAWELFNEVDGTPGYNATLVRKWTETMVDYIRENDPYHHMITISVSNPSNGFALFNVTGISYAQLHLYGNGGPYAVPEEIGYWVSAYRAFGKPVLVAEFGASYLGPVEDPLGISEQLGLWSALTSGAAGTAMTWWWDSWVDPMDLYYQFAAVKDVVSKLDFTGFKPLAMNVSGARGSAVGNGSAALLFLVNDSVASDWHNYYGAERPSSVNVSMRLKPGSYWVEVWDPTTGTAVSARQFQVGPSGQLGFSFVMATDAVVTVTGSFFNSTPAPGSLGELVVYGLGSKAVTIRNHEGKVVLTAVGSENGTRVSLPLGTYYVNGTRELLSASVSPVKIYLSPLVSYVGLSSSSASVELGEGVNLTAVVVGVNGTPLNGVRVEFYANGSEIGVSSTSADGMAALRYFPERVGSYAVSVDPLNAIVPSNVTLPEVVVGVHPAPPVTVSLSVSPGKVGLGSPLSVVVKASSNGSPASGRSIALYLNGSRIAVLSTNSTGMASLQYKPNSTGELVFTAAPESNLTARSAPVVVEVSPERGPSVGTLLLVAASALAVVLGFALAFILVGRHRSRR